MIELRRINANLLVALESLIRECSVTRAAAHAGVTQSAMSTTLAQLRELLGDPLLVRAGRRMQPTPAALAIAADLRAGVDAFARVLARARGFDPATSHERFTLALSDRVEAALLADLVVSVRAVAPDITLQVLPWGRLDPPPQLAHDIDLSVGIMLGPQSPSWPSGPPALGPRLHHAPLIDANLVTVVRRDHPRVRRRLTLKTFCALDHVLITEQPDGAGIVDDALARLGRSRRVAIRVPRHTLVGDIIARSDLIASLDRRVADRLAQTAGLRVFRTPVQLPAASFSMIWHDRTHADPARCWLRNQLQALAPHDGRTGAGQGGREQPAKTSGLAQR